MTQRQAVIHEVWRLFYRNTKITDKMLQSEIDWYKD
jgi:hypothetical protein